MASGGMSHRFLPFRELRGRESSDIKNVITPESAAADQKVVQMLCDGDHRGVLDWLPEYRKFGPEGKFGHYLIMLGALGGAPEGVHPTVLGGAHQHVFKHRRVCYQDRRRRRT